MAAARGDDHDREPVPPGTAAAPAQPNWKPVPPVTAAAPPQPNWKDVEDAEHVKDAWDADSEEEN